MNKFSKLLVTAAILPGMVDAPIALASDLEDKSKTITKENKSSDAIQDSLKTLTAASMLANEEVSAQEEAQETGSVTVRYIDLFGQEIRESKTIAVKTGDSYDMTSYRLDEIDNHHYVIIGSLIPNEVGMFEGESQVVTYVYYEMIDMVDKQYCPVTWFDVDESGNMLGYYVNTIFAGEAAHHAPSNRDGYVFDHIAAGSETLSYDRFGNFATYVYAKEKPAPVPAVPITVRYMMRGGTYYTAPGKPAENGEDKLIKETSIEGNVGETKEISYDDFGLINPVGGEDYSNYVFSAFDINNSIWSEDGQTKAPVTFSSEEQTLTFWYVEEISVTGGDQTQPGGDITVSYVDEFGQQIPEREVRIINGYYGSTLKQNAPYLAGRKFKSVEINNNVSNDPNVNVTFSNQPQTITYVYANYESEDEKLTSIFSYTLTDDEGNPIGDETTEHGPGELANDVMATWCAPEIEGYTFKEFKVDGVPSTNPTITLVGSGYNQHVEVIYTKNPEPVKGGDITIRYLDAETREQIPGYEPTVLSGNIGEQYTIVTREIPGYIRSMSAFYNAGGTFNSDSGYVDHYYEKAGVVTVNYVDVKTNEPVADSETHYGRIGSYYTEWFNLEFPYISRYVGVDIEYSNPNEKFTEDDQTITVKYARYSFVDVEHVDELGKPIAFADPYDPMKYVGDEYTTEALDIPGYVLKETPENASGIVGNDDITVTYVYKTAPAQAAPVTIKYEDQYGNPIPGYENPEVIADKYVGDTFTKTHPIIDGYTFKEVKGDGEINQASGEVNFTFSESDQKATFVYTKDQTTEVDPIKAADVTVKHVEKVTGKELPGSYLLSGNVGDAIKSDPLEFDGYTFLETEWPTEATTDDGTPAFTENPQTVTHYYTKDPVKARDVTVDHVDETGNKLAESEVKHGYIGDSYETQAKDIDGYTLKEVKGNAKGTHTDQPQKVTYVYSKNTSDTIVPPISDDNNQSSSTIMSPVSKNEVTDSIISTKDTPEVVATSPAESHATIMFTEQTNSQAELPETHADHKVTLTLTGLLTALVIGMMSVVRPKKNQ